MTRLTKELDIKGVYFIDNKMADHNNNGYTGEAINKLAKFENIFEDLLSSQVKISEELEILRNQGKTNSLKFKELMVKKLTNNNVLILFKSYGLGE